MERMTTQEETAMRMLWKNGESTVKEILALYEEPRPPYTTLASIVKNLERKHYIKARRIGNTYLYRPLIQDTEYKRATSRRMVEEYFGLLPGVSVILRTRGKHHYRRAQDTLA